MVLVENLAEILYYYIRVCLQSSDNGWLKKGEDTDFPFDHCRCAGDGDKHHKVYHFPSFHARCFVSGKQAGSDQKVSGAGSFAIFFDRLRAEVS